MSLTEQWKNGELESGWYYIECVDEPHHWIDIDFYRNDCYEDKGFCKGFFDRNDWRGIDEVLAPVPSYDHFVELTEKVKENQQLRKFLEEFNALDVAKENQQLKKLLKDYRETIYMAKGHPDAFIHMEFLNNTLFKINEVLK